MFYSSTIFIIVTDATATEAAILICKNSTFVIVVVVVYVDIYVVVVLFIENELVRNNSCIVFFEMRMFDFDCLFL